MTSKHSSTGFRITGSAAALCRGAAGRAPRGRLVTGEPPVPEARFPRAPASGVWASRPSGLYEGIPGESRKGRRGP